MGVCVDGQVEAGQEGEEQMRTARLLYNVAALRSGYEIQVPPCPPGCSFSRAGGSRRPCRALPGLFLACA